MAGRPVEERIASEERPTCELRGDSLEEVGVDVGIQVDGLLHELHDFGPTSRDSDVFSPDGTSLPPDGIATGQIASTADGVTYWVGGEAPAGNAGLPEAPIGGISELPQTQSFIKRAPDAWLSFTVSATFIETTDRNAVLGRRCPPVHADEGLVLMILRRPRSFTVDLSSVDVGQAFTLQTSAIATAHNRIAPERVRFLGHGVPARPAGHQRHGHHLQRVGADRRARPRSAARDPRRARTVPAGLDR